MAGVTVIRRRINYSGSRKSILASLRVPASGSTFDTKLHLIDFWTATSPDTDAVGGSVLGGIVTFQVPDTDFAVLFKAEGY